MANKTFFVRRTKTREADILSRIAKQAQARWGYPPSWLATWEDCLTINQRMIRYSIALVAEYQTTVAGFWCHKLAEKESETADSLLFAHPDDMLQG